MEGMLALLIPILALSIPIIALLTRARRGGAPQSPEQAKRILVIEERTQMLEGRIASLTGQLQELEAKNRFLFQLLDERNEGEQGS